MKNKELRKQVIENGTYNAYKKATREMYKYGDLTGFSELSENEINECYNIKQCRKKQRQKVEEHLLWLFETNLDLYFITLTFTNKILDNTSENTRKRYVINALKKCDDYIVNIDYGTKTEREHYHAIIGIKKSAYESRRNENKKIKLSIFDDYEKKVGNTDIKIINQEEKDAKKVSNYIAKLTLHSIKVKQKYISVKKGSNYQKYKRLMHKYYLHTHYEDYRIINAKRDYQDEIFNLQFYT